MKSEGVSFDSVKKIELKNNFKKVNSFITEENVNFRFK